MKTKAFTLVELMVVLAVIGILAGLMFPAISKVRENGRQAQCSNNLKELQTAVMSFVSNGGRFPFATTYQTPDGVGGWDEYYGWVGTRKGPLPKALCTGAAANGYVDMWDASSGANGTACITNGTLYSYVLDKRVYLCPTFVIEGKKNPVAANYTFVRSYAMNWSLNYASLYSLTNGSSRMLFTELNVATTVEGKNVSVNSVLTSGTPAINPVSATTTLIYGPQQTDGALYVGSGTLPPAEGIAAYHNGKGHVVFADGHVEFLYYSNTWATATGSW